MGQYSIKELEKLSGIKAHTLRIWEKRYHIITPERTDTNIRTYSDTQLKKLLNIAILNHHGIKISNIAKLTEQQVVDQVSTLSTETNDNVNVFIDQLCIAMVELDEVKFEKLLSNYILRFGFEKTIINIIYPFLEKIGILWLSDNITPIQEHFISNLIRQKIIVAIDSISPTQNPSAEKVVFFLPENELHEIGLLFYHFLVKSLDFKTYYLGQHVPHNDLLKVVATLKPTYLVTSISNNPTDQLIGEFITQLSEKFPDCTTLITGKQLAQFGGRIPNNIQVIKSASHLKAFMSGK